MIFLSRIDNDADVVVAVVGSGGEKEYEAS